MVTCNQMTQPQQDQEKEFKLPVFAFVITKMKESPVLPQLRLKTFQDEQPCRPIGGSEDELKERLANWIQYLQSSCISQKGWRG